MSCNHVPLSLQVIPAAIVIDDVVRNSRREKACVEGKPVIQREDRGDSREGVGEGLNLACGEGGAGGSLEFDARRRGE